MSNLKEIIQHAQRFADQIIALNIRLNANKAKLNIIEPNIFQMFKRDLLEATKIVNDGIEPNENDIKLAYKFFELVKLEVYKKLNLVN